MTTARLRLAVAGKETSETMFPLEAPFFIKSVGEPPGSPTPPPPEAHQPTEAG